MNKESNYDLVLQVIEMYEDQDIMDDFINEFPQGDRISKGKFVEFFNRYIDDMSEVQFIKENWDWVKNGGSWD